MFETAKQLNFKILFRRIFRRELFAALLLIGGLSLSGYSYLSLSQASSDDFDVQAEVDSNINDQDKGPIIVVEAAGSVVNPGVYQVPVSARMGLVIEKAGGLSKDADTNFVARDLNLAQTVSDGQKIYIPYQDEFTNVVKSSAGDSSTGPSGSEKSSDGQVSINSASLSELQTLKGIGEARAEDIISGRPYSAIEDLITNEILGEAVFEGIRSQLVL
jgi:competence protein ComEA